VNIFVLLLSTLQKAAFHAEKNNTIITRTLNTDILANHLIMVDLETTLNAIKNERHVLDTEPLLFTLVSNPDSSTLKANIVSPSNIISHDESDNASSLTQKNMLMCRICHCEEVSPEFLITPCYCAGTLKFVHQACLQQWLKSNGMKSCELCKFDFIMETRTRSFRDWEKLDMNHIERRKVLCSVTFHLIGNYF
jgi:hypothetical protein